MPSFFAVRPGVTGIAVTCPRVGCGNDEVEVLFEDTARTFTPDASCVACNIEAEVMQPFTSEERTILCERAKDALDNFDPSDAELRAAGMLA